MISLFAVHMPDFPAQLFDSLLHCALEKKERLIRYHRKEDQIRGLLGELLIRKTASEILNTPPAKLAFKTNPYGKPFLSEGGLEFNLSHAGDWVVCAFDRKPVGIDIEKIAAVDLDLAFRFFTEEEYDYIMRAHDERQRLRRFYLIWSAKESVIKAVGRGLSIPLNSFNVLSGNSLISQIILEQVTWNLVNVFLDSNYSLCVCASSSECKPIEILKMQELVSFFIHR